ncbi:toll/interleukin-1 receptor domain-containing protein [Rhodoglobus sp. NPDC076762]
MRVFISWSGSQAKLVATKLNTWLPTALVGHVDTFLSSEDIQKGQRGLNVISSELEGSDFGLVVLTRSNLASPWIHFEAGALGKSLDDGRVAPLLIDVKESDVTGPLTQFQMTSLNSKSDVWSLIRNMMDSSEASLPEESVKIIFEKTWPDLEDAVRNAAIVTATLPEARSSDDKLDEILRRVRAFERSRLELEEEQNQITLDHWQDRFMDDVVKLVPNINSVSFSSNPRRVHLESTQDKQTNLPRLALNELIKEYAVDFIGRFKDGTLRVDASD